MGLIVGENVILNEQMLHVPTVNGEAFLAGCVVGEGVVHDTSRYTVNSLLLVRQIVGDLHCSVGRGSIYVGGGSQIPGVCWVDVVARNSDSSTIMRLCHGCVVVELVRSNVEPATALLVLPRLCVPDTGATKVDGVA
jgi:hypothetical protein